MRRRRKNAAGLLLCLLAWSLAGVTEPEKGMTASPRRVPVTLVAAVSRDLELWEPSTGQVEARVAPLVSAEVAGRLLRLEVDVGETVRPGRLLAEIDPTDYRLAKGVAEADIHRLEALIRAQRLKVKRYRELVGKGSVNQSALDDAEAQLGALRAELASARDRLLQARRNLEKTRITSPVEGRVDETLASPGDYLKAGTPVIRISSLRRLRARLPYPEALLDRLRPGLPVRLDSPSVPGAPLEAEVSGVRPVITRGSRSVQVIVNFTNPGPWRPGATVDAAVRIGVHRQAVLVPETSVVRRPAGTVVYLVENGRAHQRPVRTGLRRDGWVEILSGLKAGERVAGDGAGFLADGAAVEVKKP